MGVLRRRVDDAVDRDRSGAGGCGVSPRGNITEGVPTDGARAFPAARRRHSVVGVRRVVLHRRLASGVLHLGGGAPRRRTRICAARRGEGDRRRAALDGRRGNEGHEPDLSRPGSCWRCSPTGRSRLARAFGSRSRCFSASRRQLRFISRGTRIASAIRWTSVTTPPKRFRNSRRSRSACPTYRAASSCCWRRRASRSSCGHRSCCLLSLPQETSGAARPESSWHWPSP